MLEVNTLRKAAEGGQYKADVTICLTDSGELCNADDPRAVTQLVAAGSSIPMKKAERYGLVGDGVVTTVEEREEPDDDVEDVELGVFYTDDDDDDDDDDDNESSEAPSGSVGDESELADDEDDSTPDLTSRPLVAPPKLTAKASKSKAKATTAKRSRARR